MNEKEPLDTWGTLEAMGHQSHTGHITEERFGAVSMFRVDVPALAATTEHDVTEPYSKLYGSGSIYCITPMEEATAMALLEQAAARQHRYSYPTRLAIASPSDQSDEWNHPPRDDEDDEDVPFVLNELHIPWRDDN